MSTGNEVLALTDYTSTLIVVVSVVSGSLGVLLICAIIGFIADRCGCFDVRTRRGTRPRPAPTMSHGISEFDPSSHQHFNHRPSLINENANRYMAENTEANKTTFSNGNPGNYETEFFGNENQFINEAFSSVFDETIAAKDSNKKKAVADYSGNKLFRPERKPSSSVPYPKDKLIQPAKQPKYEHIKISLADEAEMSEVKHTKPTVTVAVESFDPQAWVKTNEEEPKHEIRVAIPKNLDIEPIQKNIEHHTIEYENPKIETRKRKEQKLEEIRKQEEAKKPTKRVLIEPSRAEHQHHNLQDSNFTLGKRKVAIAGHPKIAEDNTISDSFLF